MNLEGYQFIIKTDFFDYEFESHGSKGTIKKVARFTEIAEHVYNFGFGDLDSETGEIRDKIESNNGDTDKVLATVAHIIYHFAALFPESEIFITGNTDSRTRLYQMNMNIHWSELEPLFEVFGLTNGKWEYFRHGVNYEAFVGCLKK